MSKARKRNNRIAASRGRARVLVSIFIVSGVVAASAALAQLNGSLYGSKKGNSKQGATVAPSGLSASSPSKEYVYAGGRLLATDEPAGPIITGLSPSTVTAGSADFPLTVNGSGFVSGCTIRFKGSNRTTTLVSGTQLTTTIPATDIATAGSPEITVYNPSYGTSNAISLIVGFSDVSTSSPYYAAINKIAARGITVGCSTGLYCPTVSVSREQMAVFLERTLGVFSPPTPTSQRFEDVLPSRFGYAAIDDFAVRGITSGCSTGPPKYCPDVAVTHEQMAIFIIRVLGTFNPPTPSSQRFPDVTSARGGYAFIEEYARRGIWPGCSGGNFCPDAFVTREQMAQIMVNAFGW
jgi:S-layer family protein